MATKETLHNTKPTVALDSAAYTTTQTSAAMDTLGWESLEVVVPVVSWTSGTFTPKLQECDTSGGSYTDVDATQYTANALWAATIKTGSAAKDMLRCQYFGYKRYVKAVLTGATTPSASFGVLAFQGYPRETI